ncbi:exported hypothetical protein [Cupriavidus taiwanensis]|uniref:hypothetical protein n=1 Tax=Cupriavidus taiwanensis TaxID=164546 RepID=UPI000E12C3C3|nr:hypothetical protein [Cupriavidus taiwanensis]SOZ99438.1 exported hypothetical protein [Cupriavidus taiwanensis]
MTLKIADRVKETTTTTGTGAVTLAGAVLGFRAFSAVLSVNDYVYYTIQAVDGSGVPSGEWEVGVGKYTGANTLARTVVLSSSNAGGAVNFSAGTKHVWIDVPARIADFRGVSLGKSSDQAISANTYNVLTNWTAGSFDTDSFYNGAQPTRITIPADLGIEFVELTTVVGVKTGTGGTNTSAWVGIRKNGATNYPGQIQVHGGSYDNPRFVVPTGPIKVADGDYFEALIYPDRASTLLAGDCVFKLHVLR